jgi:hypothetical protein
VGLLFVVRLSRDDRFDDVHGLGPDSEDVLLHRRREFLGRELRAKSVGFRDGPGRIANGHAYADSVRCHADSHAHSDAHADPACGHADGHAHPDAHAHAGCGHAHAEPYCDSVNGTRRSDGAGRHRVGIEHHADLERVGRGDELHGAQVGLHFVVRLSRDDSFDDVHRLGPDSEDVLLHRRRDVLDRELRAESVGFRDGPGRIANGHAYADSVRCHADSHAHSDAHSDSVRCHADRHADSDAHAHAGCCHSDAHTDAHTDSDSRFDSSGAYGPDGDGGLDDSDQPELG